MVKVLGGLKLARVLYLLMHAEAASSLKGHGLTIAMVYSKGLMNVGADSLEICPAKKRFIIIMMMMNALNKPCVQLLLVLCS